MEAPPRSIILDAKEYWSTDPNVPYLIRMQTDGPGAEPPKSIMELLHSNAVNFPDHPALVYDTLVQSGNAISYSYVKSLPGRETDKYVCLSILGSMSRRCFKSPKH